MADREERMGDEAFGAAVKLLRGEFVMHSPMDGSEILYNEPAHEALATIRSYAEQMKRENERLKAVRKDIPLATILSRGLYVVTTCDWGGCSNESVALRWDDEAGWVLVCEQHRALSQDPGEQQ